MQHDELIGQVQARAKLSSRGDAERAVRATLETLGERLPEGLTDNLAAQLPHEIGEHLRRTELLGGLGTGERFGLPGPGGLRDHRRGHHRRADDKVREALPADVRELAAAGSSGDMR